MPAGAVDTLLIAPILERMHLIDGWLDEDEADLLIAGASRAVSDLPATCTVVEIGSYCGRSTSVLGGVVKAMRSSARVYAIDPHEGLLTARDGASMRVGPTLNAFRRTIAECGLQDTVVPVVQRAQDVRWAQPIAFLFIDGLHDPASVCRDFKHFEPWLTSGAYVAFHDYRQEVPSVKAVVDELVASRALAWMSRAGTLALLRNVPSREGASLGKGE